MSRIGNKPIPIPGNAEVSFKDREFSVKGDNGKLKRTIHPSVDLKIENNLINVFPINKDRNSKAFQGLTRALLANMIKGVTDGFERSLEINGIGYKADLQGETIVLNIGYSHPIQFNLPKSITAKVEKTKITLKGNNKKLLGQTAASIRALKPPEPYKGKGIKYVEEHIIKKAGKATSKSL